MFKDKKWKKWMLNLFIVFMILQPLFDIYWLYKDEVIAIFRFSPSTIIRMGIMCILFLTTFLWWKDKKKYKYLIVTAVVYFVYAILHHINALAFSIPYGDFDQYSLFRELFYLIRMMCPLLIIFVTYEKKLTFDIFKKIVIYVALIFSVTMVVSNFFGFAMASYGGGNYFIQANFFDWFEKDIYYKYSYMNIASKGIFHMANQVSGVLICLLALVIYIYFKDTKKINILTLFFIIFAMIMLGTRVASVGWLVICVVMLIIYLFFCFMKKEIKFNKNYVIVYVVIVALFTCILPYSPVMNRVYITDYEDVVESNIDSDENAKEYKKFMKYLESLENVELTKEEEEALKKEKVEFFKKFRDSYGFDVEYTEKIYPYSEDVDFWISEMEIPFADRANHRQLKTDITKRIISLNDNKLDYVFGVSFTRLRNVPCYMENDIYVHLYSIGIVGIMLFILPYFIILMYGVYSVFKHYKEKFTFINISLLFSIALVFIAGVLSGNVFDEWICTLFLGFICGYLLYNLKRKNVK